jgi:hypothetical protein
MSDLAERLRLLHNRLRTTYDGIGHSSGRPYVYFVYPPDQERALRRLVDDELPGGAALTFYHLDLLPITMQGLAGQEQRREELLNDPTKSAGATESIIRLWARAISTAISSGIETSLPTGRPVVVLRGLAALHPLGTPTGLMEALAEQEPHDPTTGRIVPIVLFVPGIRPPQTSRIYWFLGQERLKQDFYRGEEA